MRVGIVGCGDIAHVHLPFILKETSHSLVGICDRDKDRAEALARRFNIGQMYTDYTQFLTEQKPDAIHVLTPPQSHAALALQAMESGCHVLVEKPMTLSLDEADAMIAAAKNYGVKLCVNHNQLFDPVILQVRRLVAEGAVGTVIGVDSYYGFNLAQVSERRWVDSLPGGVFQNLAPHPLSLILQFLQDPLDIYVSTLATGALGLTSPDELRVLMKGKDTIGTLSISLGIKPHLNFLRVYGSKAVLNADLANMILSMERLRSLPKAVARGLMSVEHGTQVASGAVRNAFKFLAGTLKPYQGVGNLIHAFYQSIEQEHDPPVPAESGRRVVETFERIRTHLPTTTTPPRVRVAVSNGKPKVFVTGASGFVGSHLVERLTQQGAVVRALVRPTSRIGHLQSLDIDWVDGDLADTETLKSGIEGCDVVYHCAAATKGSWSDYLEGTVRGTDSLLGASAAVGVNRFVYISSLSVYDVNRFEDHDVVPEDTPFEPFPERRGHYTHSKIEAEKLVLAYGRDKKLRITILRPGTIYGPRGKVFFPRIGYGLKNKIFLIIGPGDHLLPLAYVENVVDAICMAGCRTESIDEVYNIVDDEIITQRQYVDQLIQRAGLKAFTFHVPYAFPYIIAYLLDMKAAVGETKRSYTRSRYRLVSATKDLRYDTSRAKEQLGWKPNVSFEEGFRRTIDWYCNGRTPPSTTRA